MATEDARDVNTALRHADEAGAAAKGLAKRARRRHMAITGVVVTTGMLAIGAIGAWHIGPTWLHSVLGGTISAALIAGALAVDQRASVRSAPDKRTLLVTTLGGGAVVLGALWASRDHPYGYVVGAVAAATVWGIGAWWAGR
jgi:hypothetical protein